MFVNDNKVSAVSYSWTWENRLEDQGHRIMWSFKADLTTDPCRENHRRTHLLLKIVKVLARWLRVEVPVRFVTEITQEEAGFPSVWEIKEKDENYLTLVDRDGRYEASIRFDGRIHLYRGSRVFGWHTEYMRVLDVEALIVRLKQFGEGWGKEKSTDGR